MTQRTSLNVSLTPELEQFVSDKVSSGRYSTASEVVRDALRELERREREEAARIERLRAKIQVGLDQIERGEVVPLEQVMSDLRERLRQRRNVQ